VTVGDVSEGTAVGAVEEPSPVAAAKEKKTDVGSVVWAGDGGFYATRYSTKGVPYEQRLTNFILKPVATIKVDGSDARTILLTVRDGLDGVEQIDSSVFLTAHSFRKWCFSRGLECEIRDRELTGLVHLLSTADVPTLHGVEQVGLHLESRHKGSFILPDGDVIGDSEKYIYAEPVTKIEWDTDLRKFTDWDPYAIELLAKMNDPQVMTPILGWIAAAPLRMMFKEFPILAVFGLSGWGKTVTIETALWVFGFWTGPPPQLGGSPHNIRARMSSSNGLPVWFDEYRKSTCRADTWDYFEQALRAAWNRGTVSTGGGSSSWAELVPWHCDAPIIVSGESAFTEKSHYERSVTVNMPGPIEEDSEYAKIYSELTRIDENSTEYVHDWTGFGRSYLEWLQRRLHELHPPHTTNRQRHGLEVVKWGYSLLQDFLYEIDEENNNVYGIRLPKFDGSWVIEDAVEVAQSNPYIDALRSCDDATILQSDEQFIYVKLEKLVTWTEKHTAIKLAGNHKAFGEFLKSECGAETGDLHRRRKGYSLRWCTRIPKAEIGTDPR